MDIKLDADKLAEAQVYCNALTRDDAWDNDVNNAQEAIKALIYDLKGKEKEKEKE